MVLLSIRSAFALLIAAAQCRKCTNLGIRCYDNLGPSSGLSALGSLDGWSPLWQCDANAPPERHNEGTLKNRLCQSGLTVILQGISFQTPERLARNFFHHLIQE